MQNKEMLNFDIEAYHFNYPSYPYVRERHDSIHKVFVAASEEVEYSGKYSAVYIQSCTAHNTFMRNHERMLSIISKYRLRRNRLSVSANNNKRLKLNPKERAVLVCYKISSIILVYCQYRHIYECLLDIMLS